MKFAAPEYQKKVNNQYLVDFLNRHTVQYSLPTCKATSGFQVERLRSIV